MNKKPSYLFLQKTCYTEKIKKQMPYRRLPNTNQARLRSLRSAVNMDDSFDLAFPYKTLEDAKGFVVRYERALLEYKQCAEKQASTNKKYQNTIKAARLYISHFIQVLHMCIARKEIKVENKLLYGLDESCTTVPDLSSEEHLLEWGKKIIAGELQRTGKGGVSIYNPAIAKVRVHYDIFEEAYNDQKVLQHNTARTLENIALLNEVADTLILEIWDHVEAHFAQLPLPERLSKCQEYGVVYYYRKGETVPVDPSADTVQQDIAKV